MAGPDHARRSALLAGWLRRAAREPATATWVLRGSVVTAALCRDARPPADVDYLVAPTADDFEPEAIATTVRAIAARDDADTRLAVIATEVIFAGTSSPGVRAHLTGTSGHGDDRFQLDLAVGDPMAVPPLPIAVAGVGDVVACAAETLFGWKVHGLVEHGRGVWRAKDLYDADLLWRQATLDHDHARAALGLAFSSRGLALTALDDLRTRPTWGTSRTGARRWRKLARDHAAVDDFVATRDRLCAALERLLGPAISRRP